MEPQRKWLQWVPLAVLLCQAMALPQGCTVENTLISCADWPGNVRGDLKLNYQGLTSISPGAFNDMEDVNYLCVEWLI